MFNFANVLRTPSHDESRHIVLGTLLRAEPQEHEEVIYFAAGCFWGVEKVFWSVPGVVCTATGYMGGTVENPSYQAVCAKNTGHAETVRVVFDTRKVTAAELVATFFEIHNPTQGDRQGNDIGPQYRSVIWATTDEQLRIAQQTRDAYQTELSDHNLGQITTEVSPQGSHLFWYAEDYHQGYLFKNPDGYQCHSRTGVACPVLPQ